MHLGQCLTLGRRDNCESHSSLGGSPNDFPLGCYYCKGFRCCLRKVGDCLALDNLGSDGVTANRYRLYFWGDEHVMKLIMMIVGTYLRICYKPLNCVLQMGELYDLWIKPQ